MKIRLFLSHSNKDRKSQIIQRLINRLNNHGLEFAHLTGLSELTTGTITEKIEKEIEASDLVLVLWTSSSTESLWVKREIEIAEKMKKPFCIIVEKGVNTEGFPKGKDYFLINRERLEKNIDILIAAIFREISKKKEREIIKLKNEVEEYTGSNVSGCVAHSFGEIIYSDGGITAHTVRCGNCGSTCGTLIYMGSGPVKCVVCGTLIIPN